MSTAINTAAHIETFLLGEIHAACPELSANELRPDASLTGGLGLDSLTLSSLFAAVRGHFGHLELAPWFISASNTGTDTVDSLAHFIAARRPIAAAA